MTTLSRKGFGYHLPTPDWAINDVALREIVVTCVERRAHLPRPQAGTLQERLARAEAKLLSQQPGKMKVMRRLNEEYLGATPERKKVLEVQIQNLDSTLRTNTRAAAVIAYIVATYYRRKLSSPEIAADLGIKPQGVRRTLHHVRRVVAEMERKKKALAEVSG